MTTDAERAVMAARCPIIRAAYATDETVVIARAEKDHPPARCEYVKQAAAAEDAA